MGNSRLSAAKKAKNDEFYTRMTDIEHELVHYKDHFKGKVVLCNCDDPFESNFFKYFALNFNHLGLKHLTATRHSGSPIAGGECQPSLFDDDVDEDTGRHRKAYKAVVNVFRDTTGDGGLDMDDIRNLLDSGENELTELHGDGTYGAGDFRSKECLKLLDEADVVVTNPPFSLFREYVATLVEHDKKFVVLGNKNAITYKEIFPLLRDDKVWLGFTSPSDFTIPGGGTTKQVNGLCRWCTNLDIEKRHEDLILCRRYADDPSKYPHYDNYDAIEVSKVKDIPEDYWGVMGVPISFMDKYNPGQFDIIGCSESEGRGFSNGLWDPTSKTADHRRTQGLQTPVHPPTILLTFHPLSITASPVWAPSRLAAGWGHCMKGVCDGGHFKSWRGEGCEKRRVLHTVRRHRIHPWRRDREKAAERARVR